MYHGYDSCVYNYVHDPNAHYCNPISEQLTILKINDTSLIVTGDRFTSTDSLFVLVRKDTINKRFYFSNYYMGTQMVSLMYYYLSDSTVFTFATPYDAGFYEHMLSNPF
ncbi:MAG: hypothetical protein P4L41_07630 [Flavipsychrobacter sp.]|nr:hypothetical protein [Flavipsychrobacter sp.]